MLAMNEEYVPDTRMEDVRELATANLLWRSVLAQSVKDIYAGNLRQRGEVIRWLASRDFETICDYACVEPVSMREQIAQIASLPEALAKKYGKLLKDKIMEGIHSGE